MKPKKCDKILLIDVILLVIFGLVMISSASVVVSYNNFGHNNYYLYHQFLYGVLPGMGLLFLFQKIDYHIFKKYALLFFIATICVLILVFMPSLNYGTEGVSRWISLWGFSFQPSEIAKLTFILYLAAWLEGRKESIKDFHKGLLSLMSIVAIMSFLLIKQSDLSTLIVISVIAFAMYFIAGARIRHIFVLMSLGIIAGIAFVKVAPYRVDRLKVFLYPEIDPKGIGYQINQALLAIGSGGVFGLGFGHSRQKFNYLPEPMGDSIFAVIGEELGLIGLSVLLILFLIFAVRGFRIANKAADNFGKFIAVGITFWISFQALVNMAAITSIIPLTGITLPFISYGGSSLVASLAGAGVLLNISKHIRQ